MLFHGSKQMAADCQPWTGACPGPLASAADIPACLLSALCARCTWARSPQVDGCGRHPPASPLPF